ncbi:MAG: PAS domain-containing protein [Candidatus Dormibacteraeota bacterium]|nr:PAS domain-containing protein [Candidatus Dormibacteraeota bacterium]
MALIDVLRRTVLVASPRLSELLGYGYEVPSTVDLHVLVEDPAREDALMQLLIDGTISAFHARRRLRRADGEFLDADNWVAAWERDDRHRAIWVLSPLDGDVAALLPQASAQEWPEHVAGLVLGTFDAEWTVERVSFDVEALLGYPAHELIGHAFIDILYVDDMAAFLSTVARALDGRTAVGVDLRLHHRSGQWVRTRALITPLAAERLRFGFALAIAPTDERETQIRMADLEQRFWRIAREVAEARVFGAYERATEDASLPGLPQLTPRQREVLTLLLRGDRVRSIATALHVSESTVRNHLAEIFRKLRVHSQSSLLELLRVPSR